MTVISLIHSTALTAPVKTSSRLPLIDALRALAASTIACHHFALYLTTWSMSIRDGFIGSIFDWLRNYGRATQIFFVVGGFVMARSMSSREWNLQQVGRFVVRRYCRLGLPYLGAMALAIAACSLARGSLPNYLLGEPPTIPQILAHLFFLQDILGYESLSAGLWFVCISFQLGLLYVAMLWLRDAVARWSGRPAPAQSNVVPLLLGWAIAMSSLFYFNLHDNFDVWALYFFGQFFLGVMAYHGLRDRKSGIAFGLYAVLMIAALALHWRWRLVTAFVTGLVLFFGGKFGVIERWPTSKVVQYLGRTSYSLFLVHFPVLLVVATLWAQQDTMTPRDGLMAFLTAYALSLVVADFFYRAVEAPSARLSRQYA